MTSSGLESLSPIEQYIITSRTLEKYRNAAVRVLRHFECRKCGRCCRTIPAMISPDEVKRMSRFLRMGQADFLKKFCTLGLDGFLHLKTPCPLLTGAGRRECRVYRVRPIVCRFYPFKYDLPVLQTADWCLLGREVVTRIREEAKRVQGKWRRIKERYLSDPLDQAISTLVTRLHAGQKMSEVMLQAKEAAKRLLNPSGEKGEEVPMLLIDAIFLEYFADRLG